MHMYGTVRCTMGRGEDDGNIDKTLQEDQK